MIVTVGVADVSRRSRGPRDARVGRKARHAPLAVRTGLIVSLLPRIDFHSSGTAARMSISRGRLLSPCCFEIFCRIPLRLTSAGGLVDVP